MGSGKAYARQPGPKGPACGRRNKDPGNHSQAKGRKRSTKRKRRSLAEGLLLAVIMLVVLVAYLADIGKPLDLLLQDSLLMQEKVLETRIMMLGIDEAALKAQGRWPWPRSVVADLVDRIASGNPAAIGLDILFTEPSPDPEQDRLLAVSIARAGNVVLPIAGQFKKRTKVTTGETVLEARTASAPLPELAAAARIGHINVIPDEFDGVVRHLIPAISHEGVEYRSFSEVLYKTAAEQMGLDPSPPNGFARLGKSWNNLLENRPRIDFMGVPDTFSHMSAGSLLDGSLDPAWLEGTIVLVGLYASGTVEDAFATPLSRSVEMFGVEIHANLIQGFMDRSFQVESNLTDLLLILAACLLMLLSGFLLPSLWNLPVLAACGGGVYGLARMAYGNGLTLTLFYPWLGMVLIWLAQLVFRFVESLLERKRITGVFGKYVAPEVVKTILSMGEEGLQLGGSRREVAVLFVDVRGFTPLSERTDPETLVKVLNEYLELTATSIFRHKGTLDKFIGDATMAVFNAPLDLPDYRMAAIRAALDMKQGAEALNEKLEARFGMRLHFGIGVHAGPAVIGNIGASFRMDYTAIGDTVNTAARLESNAKPEDILIGQALYEEMKDRITAEFSGNLKLKGKAEEMAVWRVTGLAGTPAQTPL